jgi:hypothetical protein
MHAAGFWLKTDIYGYQSNVHISMAKAIFKLKRYLDPMFQRAS